jgi:exopolysaccharide production protein ExoZ
MVQFSPHKRLDWVELGRGLAALAVVLVHASNGMKEAQYSGQAFMKDWFFAGFLGVDFFFVLSGFIILYVHFYDIEKPQRALRYGWRRVTRIFPSYWIILITGLTFNHFLQSDRAPVTLSWLEQQASLVPGFDPWLGPAWTLRFELIFYVIFSVLLFSRKIGMTVVAAWFLLIVTTSFGIESFEPKHYRYNFWNIITSPYNLNFFFGMSLAYALRQKRYLTGLVWLYAALGGMFALWSFSYGIHWHSWIRYPGFGVVFAALLGLLLLINQRDWPLPKIFTFLGTISYSLYLSHALFIGYFLAALARSGLYPHIPEVLIFLGQIATAIICSTLIYRLLEKPLLNWAHTKFN